MVKIALILGAALLLGGGVQAQTSATNDAGRMPHMGNPILPGYFADPSIVQDGGKIYIYATLDPWGDQTLGCWESSDWKNWTYRVLNWPTKAACTSSTSAGAMVWAPSVVKGRDGKFHMVVSVGSEVWAGVADQPLGPWRNALGAKPLVPKEYKPGYHMIDAEYFLDEDGQAYLYWGSGLNWTNGRCWAVKLKADLATFDGEVLDVTPKNYFEAPFMFKHAGRYFLMYSSGNTTTDTYEVRYAVGISPFGPFTEPLLSPILSTDKAMNVVSPGHHAIFTRGGEAYILYHRHSIPRVPRVVDRQTCVDRLTFTADGLIAKVKSTHEGPPLVQGRLAGRHPLAATATASSQASPATGPEFVLDDNYATRWAAAPDAKGAWIQLDLGAVRQITSQEIRPEFAWKPVRFAVQSSANGKQWERLADFTKTPATGSPIIISKGGSARYLRLTFPDDTKGEQISLFEWLVF